MTHLSLRLFQLLLILAVSLPSMAGGRGVLDRLPTTSELLKGYRADSVTDRLAAMPLHDIEGLGEFTGQGTLMAIERDPLTHGAATRYRMVAVRSSDLALRPGTVMGYLTPTSRRGRYDARIYTATTDEGTRLRKLARHTITLSDESSRIIIKPYGRLLRFNWWRLIFPYMYRSLITPIERREDDLDGCIRVYPPPAVPLNPVYL